MANPFSPIASTVERTGQSLKQRFRSMFEIEPVEEQAHTEKLVWAAGVVGLHDLAAFRDLYDKIEALANLPLQAGGDIAQLSAAIGHQNGIKAVIALIRTDLARARRIHDATRSREQGG